MQDPCWLPSAIMQTTGAVIGIYLIIYIYALPKIKGLSKIYRRNILLTMLRAVFYLSLILGILTIISNTIWLERLIETRNMIFPTLKFISISIFFLTLFFILIFSLLTVNLLSGLEKTDEEIKERDEKIEERKELIRKDI